MGKPTYEELEDKIRNLEKKLQIQSTTLPKLNVETEKPASILIIDDDDSVRSSLSSYLEDAGYLPFTACDGKKGIEAFEQENIDLILVDLRMPEMDGYDVIKHIYKESPQTPLIVVSGASGIQDAIETMKIGAWDYLVKPIREMSTLVHSIEKALDHSHALNEKQQAEQLLVQSEEKYSKLIETTSSGFWQVDKNEITTEVNYALSEMLGYTSKQMIGKPASFFINKEQEKLFNGILSNPSGSSSKSFDIVLRTKNGKELNALFDTALTFDNNNEISGAFAFVSDITESKKNHQLAIVIETAGAICHELHQPMQTIFGYVEHILLEMTEQDKNYEFVTIIKESIDRMTRITNKLSNITNHETKKYVDKIIVDIEKSSSEKE
ncbi:MAG: response regulator [Desulfobacteraceae bacterium]|nr:response regulator [Desulfobacteraceae bacterium]